MSEKFVFIIGNPRSGTSLLRIILNSHRNVTIPPECGFIHWWFDKYKKWPNNNDLSNYINDLKNSKKIETWRLNFTDLSNYLNSKNPESYLELISNVIKFYGETNLGKTKQNVLGDKNNYYIDHLEELFQINPEAQFIFIIRDPKDVYCSYRGIDMKASDSKYIPKLTNDVNLFANKWVNNHAKIVDFISNNDINNYIIIEYEDLIKNLKLNLKKLTNFLQVYYDSQMENYYLKNDEPLEFMAWKKKTLTPPDATSIGRYIELLTDSEILTIDEKTKNVRTRLDKLIANST